MTRVCVRAPVYGLVRVCVCLYPEVGCRRRGREMEKAMWVYTAPSKDHLFAGNRYFPTNDFLSVVGKLNKPSLFSLWPLDLEPNHNPQQPLGSWGRVPPAGPAKPVQQFSIAGESLPQRLVPTRWPQENPVIPHLTSQAEDLRASAGTLLIPTPSQAGRDLTWREGAAASLLEPMPSQGPLDSSRWQWGSM